MWGISLHSCERTEYTDADLGIRMFQLLDTSISISTFAFPATKIILTWTILGGSIFYLSLYLSMYVCMYLSIYLSI